MKITPVILSGGSGTRLWPLSRTGRPKQMLPLTERRTMLQLTAARTADPQRFEAPVVVANAAHADEIATQLAEVGCPPSVLLLEPAARNTAPAIALAALSAPSDAVLLVMPSDQVIGDVAAFDAAILKAMAPVADGWMVTFGIEPTAPETGYGYIRSGEAIGQGVQRVASFVEKPSRDVASSYLAEGGYAWNSGMFMFRADAYVEALALHAPAMLDAARKALASAVTEGSQIRPDRAEFLLSPSDSIDYAVMERADRVAVVPVSMGWSDVGSWDALYDLAVDADGHCHEGDVVAIDTAGCMIRSTGPVVAAVGVSDLIVVATPDAVLVMRRGESQDVKRAVEALKLAGHPTLDRVQAV